MTSEDYRTLATSAREAVREVSATYPAQAATITAWADEIERRHRVATNADLATALAMDTYGLLAVVQSLLTQINTGLLPKLVQIESDRAATDLAIAQDKADRRSDWRANWKLILGSGGVGMAIITGAYALAQTLLGGAP